MFTIIRVTIIVMILILIITTLYRHQDSLEDSKPTHSGKHCKDIMVNVKDSMANVKK